MGSLLQSILQLSLKKTILVSIVLSSFLISQFSAVSASAQTNETEVTVQNLEEKTTGVSNSIPKLYWHNTPAGFPRQDLLNIDEIDVLNTYKNADYRSELDFDIGTGVNKYSINSSDSSVATIFYNNLYPNHFGIRLTKKTGVTKITFTDRMTGEIVKTLKINVVEEVNISNLNWFNRSNEQSDQEVLDIPGIFVSNNYKNKLGNAELNFDINKNISRFEITSSNPNLLNIVHSDVEGTTQFAAQIMDSNYDVNSCIITIKNKATKKVEKQLIVTLSSIVPL